MDDRDGRDGRGDHGERLGISFGTEYVELDELSVASKLSETISTWMLSGDLSDASLSELRDLTGILHRQLAVATGYLEPLSAEEFASLEQLRTLSVEWGELVASAIMVPMDDRRDMLSDGYYRSLPDKPDPKRGN